MQLLKSNHVSSNYVSTIALRIPKRMKWPDVMEEDVSSIERRGGKEDFLGGGGFVFLGTSIASMWRI